MVRWFAALAFIFILSMVPAPGSSKAFAQDIMHFFRDQLDIATPMWDSPVQDFATDQIRRALEQIMHKVATPRSALAEAQKACQSALDKVLQADA